MFASKVMGPESLAHLTFPPITRLKVVRFTKSLQNMKDELNAVRIKQHTCEKVRNWPQKSLERGFGEPFLEN